MSNVNALIGAILAREGGYVNNSNDKGGPTNYGITQATLAAWRGKPVSAEDVKFMAIDEAVAIYANRYVKPFERFSASPKLMDLCVDSAVQHGVGRVQAWLQDIPSIDPSVNYRELLRKRIKFYGEIITTTPSQAVFARGWMARIAEVIV